MSIGEGDKVEYEEKEGKKGMNAVNVRVIQNHIYISRTKKAVPLNAFFFIF
jgi:hypothetical protein